MHLRLKMMLASWSAFSCALALYNSATLAQTALPQVDVTVASPIRRTPARPSPQPAPAQPAPAQPTAASSPDTLVGTIPIITDQFATITVVPNDELRRNGASTLGDLLFEKPGITGSSFAPGASSRPIIRGLDVNRVRIQENGTGANGASDLGEDHFVPVDPLTSDKVEVVRGPATLRFGSQAIGGVVESTNNRIPTYIPDRGVGAEFRGAGTSVDSGLDGAVLLDAGGGNFAMHADAFGRTAQDYRIPSYPYLTPPNPADALNATQPGNFNGHQPNSAAQSNGQSVGGSYIFNEGFFGLALTQNDALYHIPGIDGEDHNTRIDAHQTKLMSKGEWRSPSPVVDAVRFWGGVTDYKHSELGLADDTNPASDGIRQTFTNKEQEGRMEAQLVPFNLRFATLTTAIGTQSGHQELTAPSPDNAGLWDPNSNWRIAGYIFNEFKFSETTKAQIAGRIEQVSLSGLGRSFDAAGTMTATPASPSYTPMSASAGLIQKLPWDLVGSITAQYIERAPKPAELFSGGPHDATNTFDKGNPNLGIEAAQSIEVGVRRATGPFRFEATAYYTRFNGFIFRQLTGNTCNGDTGACGPGVGDLNEALYSQANAIFRGGEFQSQWDLVPVANGFAGIESQFDVVRATFTDGTNVPRIPPVRVGGGIYWRNDAWFARVRLLHAFAQNDIAPVAETPTPGYDDLRAEVSYTWKSSKPRTDQLSEVTFGLVGTNLLNQDIRNSVSYTKDQVLLPGASTRLFARLRY
ncbi:MAG TPA: TonB-dependent receptor [Pseudolabrys sp.]|nr:TonB-dependent receptor [Pseudolabrys sp.]